MAIEASNLTGKERYEFERRKANDNYLSDSIYRIDYENYLKRKQDIEYTLAGIVSTVEEKRASLENDKAEKDRVNSHGNYYYRNTIDEEIKWGLWLTATILFCPHLIISIPSVILYGVLTGKKNKNKILADIDNRINFKLRDLQTYEKRLADVQKEYEMIIQSEPKRENY